MNRKGFTLIEVLAVVVVLGIVLVIAVPNILDVYKNSKLKSEEIFADRLSGIIDDYMKLNIDEISFTIDNFNANKSHKIVTNAGVEETVTYEVKVQKGTISVQDLINSRLLSYSDYINAGNKEVNCNRDDKIIEIYKDSDYVYCHRVKKNSLGCLTNEYKSSISGDYVINTCIWEEVS